MHKLTQMNVKLQHVIRDITGKTGHGHHGGHRRRTGPAATDARDPRIKADEATIARSLQGHWREEHIFESQALELYRVYRSKITECDREMKPSWSGSKTAATSLRLPMAKSAIRETRPALMSGPTVTG